MKAPGIHSFLLLLSVPLIFVGSCNNEQDGALKQEAVEEVSELHFGNEVMKLPRLSKSANDLVISWGAFEDFDAALNAINGASLSGLKNSADRLITITDSLATNFPKRLDAQPIRSRLIVVSTEVHLLKQQADKARPDSSAIAEQISHLEEAASELYFHIEEKLQKDAIDRQRMEDERNELEKQKRFLDSVNQVELNDRDN